jgi:toxin YoeB
MKYAITFAPEAKEGLAKLKHSEPSSYKKAVKLLNEIADHP